ncbi:NADH-quinone oxidoreductase subunit N [Limnoglobus roseus]|uniref:NADH-quinone oxidoreductase subunit N n=1 Tax=Limnoglobus roseus TaxID=2598579 RepID=A0A5C1AGZ0_9BACT|nr:NADH-quinone oxidoreductase subunit N [Limnoglobus roseus]QEL17012.1 NADH-quinone oxidoreductase subunit L [Limnoglobus roseus]
MNPLLDGTRIEALTGVFKLVVPEIALVGVACVLFVLGLFTSSRFLHTSLAVLGLAGAFAVALVAQPWETTLYDGLKANTEAYYPILPSAAATLIRYLTLAAGLVLMLLSTKEATREIAADYLACLLIAVAGTSLVARANDLVTLYLALEMISVPTYVLLYLPHRGKPGQEAAVKYFVLSILSSAVTLFGFSYLFGLTGSTNLSAINAVLTAANKEAISPLAVLAMVLVVAGLGFRITAVPFHYYAPDVYQGGPTAVVAQLSVLPKVAGFLALARLLGIVSGPLNDLPFPTSTQVPLLLWVLAAATMTLGNVMALMQDNLKRILAYSGVAHAGYMLLGLVTASAYATPTEGLLPRYVSGFDGLIFYLVGYALMTLGTFAILAYLNSADQPTESVDDLAGLHQTNPFAAAMLFVALLSLIGIPLTAGFTGKLFLFLGLYDSPTVTGMGNAYKTLTVIAAINAAIGAVYYLRLLGVIYLRSPLRPAVRHRGKGPMLAAVLCTVGTLVVGIYPSIVWDLVKKATPATAHSPALVAK